MNKLSFFICIFLGLTLFSCNEEKWLKEEPLDFNSPEFSYETTANFKQAVNFMFDILRYYHFTYADHGFQNLFYIGGDLYYSGWPDNLDDAFNCFHPYINSTQDDVQKNWSLFYNVVSKANDILGRLETNASMVPEADKLTFKGEALFFRAYYYRLLAHIWGDVPLVTEMLTAPTVDFTRNPRDEVYAQCQADLEEAARLLGDIEKVADGAINKQVAQHLLAEIYICRGNYTKAIEAATTVINHPAMGLMTERFGTVKDQPGDVFWDLFRGGNQNRKPSGNTESLLVIQFDYLNGSPYECMLPRFITPQLRLVSILKKGMTNINDPTHRVNAFPDFTKEDGGRGNGYFASTHHFKRTIWGLKKEDDRQTQNISERTSDIRTSKYNICRDWRIDNVNAEGWGQWVVQDRWLRDVDTFAQCFPCITKFNAYDALPDPSYQLNKNTGVRDLTSLGKHILVNSGNSAHGSFKDEYLIRLSETYLLLAEAYVRNNQPALAADAINVVRSRAKASPASAAEMNIDYILDERLRELAGEEMRNVTLFRMGKFVERARKYNPAGYHVADWQNLYPIPYSEIEKNTKGTLTQNPGYAAGD